jgi:cholesterol transport system auxiliary component
MRLLTKTAVMALAASLSLGLSGCSGLLGGGKPPANLVTLTPEAPEPANMGRTVAAGQAVTIGTPAVRRELGTVRVPVQVTPTDVQYVAKLQLVDTPAHLFQGLLEETVRRTTNRVVLGSAQTTLDPGLIVSGDLQHFGYDTSTGQVVVTYDGSLSTAGGSRVETRRFTATAPADGTAASVGPALNRAANQVALDVAKWIGSSGS